MRLAPGIAEGHEGQAEDPGAQRGAWLQLSGDADGIPEVDVHDEVDARLDCLEKLKMMRSLSRRYV
jgi:hypothetical protein